VEDHHARIPDALSGDAGSFMELPNIDDKWPRGDTKGSFYLESPF
jgi:hypothetical protein